MQRGYLKSQYDEAAANVIPMALLQPALHGIRMFASSFISHNCIQNWFGHVEEKNPVPSESQKSDSSQTTATRTDYGISTKTAFR
jgi:hypothetical protein